MNREVPISAVTPVDSEIFINRFFRTNLLILPVNRCEAKRTLLTLSNRVMTFTLMTRFTNFKSKTQTSHYLDPRNNLVEIDHDILYLHIQKISNMHLGYELILYSKTENILSDYAICVCLSSWNF